MYQMNKSFFNELPQDLLNDDQTAADAVFDAFNDSKYDAFMVKNRDNYIKSLYKSVGFKKEIAIDSTILADFFSTEESATVRAKSFYDDSDEERLLEIRFIIHNLLPNFERDIMSLIFDYNKIQEDIGVILGLSQEMVNYYKKRAIHRILHFYHHRKIDINDMRACLLQYISKRQLEAMMLYFFKHNQRIVSKELGISQSAVSARLKQGLKKLKRRARYDKRVAKYYDVFDNLTKQKSLYSSQTRMNVISEVNNYSQFDDDNQRISAAKTSKKKKAPQKVELKSTESKPKVKLHIRRKISKPVIANIARPKKIKFNRSKLKTLRRFFKR